MLTLVNQVQPTSAFLGFFYFPIFKPIVLDLVQIFYTNKSSVEKMKVSKPIIQMMKPMIAFKFSITFRNGSYFVNIYCHFILSLKLFQEIQSF